MSAKPTLGYASRTEAVVALTAQGLSRRQIAQRIGINSASVAAFLCSAERPWKLRAAEQQSRKVAVPITALDTLRPAAEARGISVNALVRRIVKTVADEGMVDAVLDDGGRS